MVTFFVVTLACSYDIYRILSLSDYVYGPLEAFNAFSLVCYSPVILMIGTIGSKIRSEVRLNPEA